LITFLASFAQVRARRPRRICIAAFFTNARLRACKTVGSDYASKQLPKQTASLRQKCLLHVRAKAAQYAAQIKIGSRDLIAFDRSVKMIF
jgi:hypothetical protein